MDIRFFWLAYTASNLIALCLLWAAWAKPTLARFLFFVLFAWASYANTSMALHNPGDYLTYAEYSWLPFYRDFINGFFAQHTQEMVLIIAAGQLCIAMALWGKGWVFRLGCIGGMAFLLGIAPLGFSSAFPFSLIAGAGLWLLWKNSGETYLGWALFSSVLKTVGG